MVHGVRSWVQFEHGTPVTVMLQRTLRRLQFWQATVERCRRCTGIERAVYEYELMMVALWSCESGMMKSHNVVLVW